MVERQGEENPNPEPRRALQGAKLIWISSIMGALLAPGVGLMVQFMGSPKGGAAAPAGQAMGNQWPMPLIFGLLAAFLIVEAIVLGLVIPAFVRKSARAAWKNRADDLVALSGIANMYVTVCIVRAGLILMPAVILCVGFVTGLWAWWAGLLVPVLITLGFYQPTQRKLERFIAEATGATVRPGSNTDPYGAGGR